MDQPWPLLILSGNRAGVAAAAEFARGSIARSQRHRDVVQQWLIRRGLIEPPAQGPPSERFIDLPPAVAARLSGGRGAGKLAALSAAFRVHIDILPDGPRPAIMAITDAGGGNSADAAEAELRAALADDSAAAAAAAGAAAAAAAHAASPGVWARHALARLQRKLDSSWWPDRSRTYAIFDLDRAAVASLVVNGADGLRALQAPHDAVIQVCAGRHPETDRSP